MENSITANRKMGDAVMGMKGRLLMMAAMFAAVGHEQSGAVNYRRNLIRRTEQNFK